MTISSSNISAPVDFLIITAVADEFEAICKYFPNLNRLPPTEDPWIYYSTIVTSPLIHSSIGYRIVILPLFGMRRLTALSAAKDGINRWKPRYVLLVGISAGMAANNVHVGELLISEQLIDYENQIIGEQNTRTQPKFFQSCPKLLRASKAINIQEVLNKHKISRPEELAAPTCRSGIMASGDKMIRDPMKLEPIRQIGQIIIGSDLLGCEMEAAGVAYAVEEAECRPGFLMIRAVSDLAGRTAPRPEVRAYVCDLAASFLQTFLVSGPVPVVAQALIQDLSKRTNLWLREVSAALSNGVEISREKLRNRLIGILSSQNLVVVYGHSGMGKSALVKSIIVQQRLHPNSFCLYSDEAIALESVGQGNPLSSIASYADTTQNYMIFDALERLVTPENRRQLGRIIKSFLLANNWKIILICQPQAWESIRNDMVSILDQESEYVDVNLLTRQEIETVLSQISSASTTLLRPELLPIIGRPKILDLVCIMLSNKNLVDFDGHLGESEIINWFWDNYLRTNGRDVRHAQALMELAKTQADNFQYITPISDLKVHAQLLEALLSENIVYERQDSFGFSHELYGDYVRQRFLLSHIESNRPFELISRLGNTQWHRSIRLVALHYLESGSNGIERWHHYARMFQANEALSVGLDLFLEAVAFVANPSIILNELKFFMMSEVNYLSRFLTRFLLLATSPNRTLIGHAAKQWDTPITSSELAVLERELRLPSYGPAWIPILKWLSDNSSDAIRLAPEQMIQVIDIWLLLDSIYKNFNQELPLKSDLCTMTLDLISSVSSCTAGQVSHFKNEFERLCLRFLEYGSHDHDRFEAIINELTGIDIRLHQEPVAPQQEIPAELRPLMVPIFHGEVQTQDPWPSGPKTKPNRTFQKVALSQAGAALLVNYDPILAKRIFQALLIEPPSDYLQGSGSRLDKCYGLQNIRDTGPPFYDFPPMVSLLEKDAEVAIDFAVKLIDFTTDRWGEDRFWWRPSQSTHEHDSYNSPGAADDEAPTVSRLSLEINGETYFYLGDQRVIEWHRGIHGPEIAAAVLMSLEKWLYEQKKDEKLERLVLDKLLKATHSAAIIGVLFDLSLRDPSWLEGVLEPFVMSWQLYEWNQHRPMTVSEETFMLPWGYRSRGNIKRRSDALAWYQMPHRQISFLKLATFIYVNRRFAWPVIDSAKANWLALLPDCKNQNLTTWLNQLLALFNSGNWQKTETDGRFGYEYRPPAEILPDPGLKNEFEGKMKLHFFSFRCQTCIEKDMTLSDAELVELLEFAQHAIPDSETEFLTGGRWGLKCAAAAVAIVQHWEWVSQRTEWMSCCKEWLLSACQALASQEEIGDDPSVGLAHWDYFCSLAVVQLWDREPDTIQWRLAVATLVGTPFNSGRTSLFLELAKIQHRHRDDFSRLLYLGACFARIQMIYHYMLPTMAKKLACRKVFQIAANQFAKKRLSSHPPNLVELARNWPLGLRSPLGLKQVPAGFYGPVLWTCFEWVRADNSANQVNQADDHRFRHDVITSLGGVVLDEARALSDGRQSLDFSKREQESTELSSASLLREYLRKFKDFVVFLFRSMTGKSPDVFSYKHDQSVPVAYQLLIIDCYASTTIKQTDQESIRELISAWFGLEPKCHYFAKAFIEAIYSSLYKIESNEKFAEVLEVIFVESIKSESWILKNTETAGAVIGWGLISVSEVWPAKRMPVVERLKLFFEQWCRIATYSGYSIKMFCRIMLTPAMENIRLEALCWLAVLNDSVRFDDKEASTSIMDLLETIWNEQKTAMSQVISQRNAYEVLLSKLVAKQNNRAILLAERTKNA